MAANSMDQGGAQKSLAEIQAEEQRQERDRQERERREKKARQKGKRTRLKTLSGLCCRTRYNTLILGNAL